MTVEARLLNCLAQALPSVPHSALLDASNASVPQWDSLATVSLITLVEQEFGIKVAFEDLPHFSSAKALLRFVLQQVK